MKNFIWSTAAERIWHKYTEGYRSCTCKTPAIFKMAVAISESIWKRGTANQEPQRSEWKCSKGKQDKEWR